MSYKYVRPSGQLYTVNASKWMKVFPNYRLTIPWAVKVEVYMNEDYARVQFVHNALGKACLWASVPILYVLGTLAYGIPETNKGIYRALFLKRSGSFDSMTIYKDDREGSGWNILKELVG